RGGTRRQLAVGAHRIGPVRRLHHRRRPRITRIAGRGGVLQLTATCLAPFQLAAPRGALSRTHDTAWKALATVVPVDRFASVEGGVTQIGWTSAPPRPRWGEDGKTGVAC